MHEVIDPGDMVSISRDEYLTIRDDLRDVAMHCLAAHQCVVSVVPSFEPYVLTIGRTYSAHDCYMTFTVNDSIVASSEEFPEAQEFARVIKGAEAALGAATVPADGEAVATEPWVQTLYQPDHAGCNQYSYFLQRTFTDGTHCYIFIGVTKGSVFDGSSI